MKVHELQGLIQSGIYDQVDCNTHQIKHLLGLDDIHDIKSDYDLNNYFNVYQVKERLWVITDIENYYVATIRSYCSDNYCLCSNTYLYQVAHTRLNFILRGLWEQNRESYAESNPFACITMLTEIEL